MGSLLSLPHHVNAVEFLENIYDCLEIADVQAASQTSFNAAVQSGLMASIILDETDDLLYVGGMNPVLARTYTDIHYMRGNLN